MTAQQKPAYGRSRQRSFFPAQQYDGENYYGRSPLKPSPYGWLIILYFFVGGLAGAAQILATVADLFGKGQHDSLVRKGRLVALLGTLASPALLIADLHVPQRFYNILRIFRKTSPMSIGSYILSAFGLFSGLTAVFGWLGSWIRPFRTLARLTQLPAALAGIGMSIYTGVLLSGTSTPLWAALPRRLPALFGLSATATATAALSLVDAPARSRLDRLCLLLGLAEIALSHDSESTLAEQNVAQALHEEPWHSLNRYGVWGAGLIFPLICRLLNLASGNKSAALSRLASLGTLVGGLLLRALYVLAGNRSAERPDAAFQRAQPPELGDLHTAAK